MINGILESRNNLLALVLTGLIFCNGCKEKNESVVSTPEVKYQTNIRFATKTDGYKEKSSFDRLTTDKTEVTSTQFQMEGPTWENENVAFRNYFDARNGMDIFGKTTTDMVLDSVGIDENYHELQDWGMDILKVGNSLGAGAIGMIVNDSLYRVGVGAHGSFRIIEETPNLSSLEFSFKDWKVQGRNYNVTHTITIKSGTHYYEGNIKVEGLTGDETLVAGIVDHEVGSKLLDTTHYKMLSTYGNQDTEGLKLGMALAVNDESFLSIDEAKSYKGEQVDKTHLLLMKGNNVTYKFFAGWELQDELFKEEKGFQQILFEELM